ncbi:MAG TPA: AMP-binding protein [Micromonosporaceae bacterium]|nr:AMP-binding protein [Micromonosporaceae bacterium]
MSTLFTRFRDCAVRHPELPAVEVAGQTVRYRELLDLVERLAGRLAAVAGRHPAAVGLLAVRSLAAYAGYLAALRLGATVVPLHPELPVARNARMCRSAGVDVVVADDAGAVQLATLVAQTGAAALALRSGGGTPWYWSLDTPPLSEPYQGQPEGIAYTLFTSGSTGEPKGVPIRHRNLDRYLTHCIDRYGVGPGARLAPAFELTFDGSVFGMFVTWCSGATLVVPRPEDLLAPARFVTARQVTHWFSVPSLVSIAHRQRMLPVAGMPELRWSLFGGEQLTFDQARAWAAAAPHSVIENLYGPTEVTISCTGYRLPADPAYWPATPNGTVPIGPVHPHLEMVVLAEDGLTEVVPTEGGLTEDGSTRDGPATADGELCVRGPQRFDGYLDPADNQGRFIYVEAGRARPCDDPVVPGDAWYRTGDRVRVGADGVMVHLGRLDDQVKIRGYRIELGEIESVLREHPKVLDAVALVSPAGSPALHAVYTGEPVDPAELATLAGERLPPYMLPAHYRYVDALPVNVHGKVDRRRLTAELGGADLY